MAAHLHKKVTQEQARSLELFLQLGKQSIAKDKAAGRLTGHDLDRANRQARSLEQTLKGSK